MERPAVFITYFQSTIQIGLLYQLLLSGYFFPKFDGRLNFMATFFAFPFFCEKTYEKTYNFYDLFSNILSWFTLSEKFVLWKFVKKKNGGSLKMFTIYYSFSQIWATFATKVTKRPIFFFTYFQSTTSVLHLHKIWWSKSFFEKKETALNMSIKALLFQQLWTIFWTNMKNPSTLVTYSSSFFPSLHYHAILWRLQVYNTNDRGFNVANKLLLISNSIFFTPCF